MLLINKEKHTHIAACGFFHFTKFMKQREWPLFESRDIEPLHLLGKEAHLLPQEASICRLGTSSFAPFARIKEQLRTRQRAPRLSND